jgi:hypothetical protein
MLKNFLMLQIFTDFYLISTELLNTFVDYQVCFDLWIVNIYMKIKIKHTEI